MLIVADDILAMYSLIVGVVLLPVGVLLVEQRKARSGAKGWRPIRLPEWQR